MTGSRATLTPAASAWVLAACALLLALARPGPVAAQESAAATPPEPAGPGIEAQKDALDEAIRLRVKGNEVVAELQKQIDEVADETDALAAQYRTAVKQLEAIQKYNDQMRTLVDSQQAELDSVADQLNRVEEVGRNVTPLMIRMIDALEAFVELDIPFLHDERRATIAMLRELMDRADVSSATKFRQIMEAYQSENEFGRTIEAYRGQVEIGGREITADLLRFGRIALVFQTLDGTTSGVWNRDSGSWEVLPASYTPRIRTGLRIARRLEPPDLIQLPLPPPEGERAGDPAVARAPGPGAAGGTP